MIKTAAVTMGQIKAVVTEHGWEERQRGREGYAFFADGRHDYGISVYDNLDGDYEVWLSDGDDSMRVWHSRRSDPLKALHGALRLVSNLRGES